MAAALLVAGPTLTFWIPWQTPFASTSSYSSVVQSARLLCRRVTCGSFQFMHMSRDDLAIYLIEFDGGDKHYSTNNVATKVSFDT